jgi:hypothetical protein
LGRDVYGPAHHDSSADFILELSDTCSQEDLPLLMGGDFNLIRSNKDINRGSGNQNLLDLFNNFIGQFQLREIFISGPRITWSNKQKDPTLIKLDRILVSESWEVKYPTCHAWSKARVGSDHCPIILNTSEHGAARPNYFYFNDQWLLHENFKTMVQNKWNDLNNVYSTQSYSLNNWHGFLQKLRQFLRGWNLNLKREQRAKRELLIKRIQELDLIA